MATEVFNSEGIKQDWDSVAPFIKSFEIPGSSGGVNPGDGRAIFYLIRHFRPRSVLEVGTHVGASTIHIAAALDKSQSSESNGRPRLSSVDARDVNDPLAKPWLRHGTRHSPAEMVDKMCGAGLVEFVVSPSLDYLASCARKYDFIFLDGDHASQTVYREIPAAMELLEENGLILLHDYFPELKPLWSNGSVIPGPFLATERLIVEGAPLQALPLGRLPWPTKLESNISSLALLARS